MRITTKWQSLTTQRSRRLISLAILAALMWCLFMTTRPISQVQKPVFRPIVDFMVQTNYVYPTDMLYDDDYQRLLNTTEFGFNLNILCERSYLLLVIVHSQPQSFESRKSIRETWAEVNSRVKVIFLLCNVIDAYIQEKIFIEYSLYGDVVEGSLFGAHTARIFKDAMALKYAIYHCPQAAYVLMTEDHVFVQVGLVLRFLKNEILAHGANWLRACKVENHMLKYYCYNRWILLSQDILFLLYKAVQFDQRFIWDGLGVLVPNVGNLRRLDVKELSARNEKLQAMFRTFKDTGEFRRLDGFDFLYVYGLTAAEMRIFGRYLETYPQ